jgi:hypothetical protein
VLDLEVLDDARDLYSKSHARRATSSSRAGSRYHECVNCTLFSVRESDLAATGETSLPNYNDASARLSPLDPRHTLELRQTWSLLHDTLGGHPAEHPLGFLSAGGQPIPAFDDGVRSSGRFFAPNLVVQMLAAIAQITKPPREVERLRVFLATAVAADRGIIVHLFS